LPVDPIERAIVRSMAQLVVAEMHPLCNLRVLRYLREVLGQDEATVDAWYRHWMAEGFAALEPMLARHTGDGRHCFGRAVTLADLCLVPQVYNAQRFGCDLEPYPRVTAIAAAMAREPAFAAAAPERQPDAE
jgi:maleylpyruvate isomerase